MFQFDGVNVSRVGVVVASPLSLLVTTISTSDTGPLVSTTVNESRSPISGTTVEPPDCTTEKPATSLSTLITDTVRAASPS